MEQSNRSVHKRLNSTGNDPILRLCLGDETDNVYPYEPRYEDISLAGSSLMYVVDSTHQGQPAPDAGSSLLCVVDSYSDPSPNNRPTVVMKRDNGVMYERGYFTQEAASDYTPPACSTDYSSQGSMESMIEDSEQRAHELEEHISAIKRTFDAKRWHEFKRSLPLTITCGAILASIILYAYIKI